MTYAKIISEIRLSTQSMENDLTLLGQLEIFKADYMYKHYTLKSKPVPNSYFQSFLIKLQEGELMEKYITKLAILPLKKHDGTKFKHFGNSLSYHERSDFESCVNAFTNLKVKVPCFYHDNIHSAKTYRIVFPIENLMVATIRAEGVFANPFELRKSNDETYPADMELIGEFLKSLTSRSR